MCKEFSKGRQENFWSGRFQSVSGERKSLIWHQLLIQREGVEVCQDRCENGVKRPREIKMNMK